MLNTVFRLHAGLIAAVKGIIRVQLAAPAQALGTYLLILTTVINELECNHAFSGKVYFAFFVFGSFIVMLCNYKQTRACKKKEVIWTRR